MYAVAKNDWMLINDNKCLICCKEGSAVNSWVHCPRCEGVVCMSHCMKCRYLDDRTSLIFCRYRKKEYLNT
ncbi:hypothetical protein [Clostridium sp. YIM B02506]|uniref:hypothetical protein n=1 Tax=Clostridium sp. YIM B02506 TaxID=2910680 RepID=UPI001EEDEC88|nr:hypothetical protein [Clostridium sp. YIM B02506]